MTGDQQPGPPQPPIRPHPGRDLPATRGSGQADRTVPWGEFGGQVLAAHHRNGLGAQCVCGSLMYYCPVIAAAQHHGLPTDDPRGRT